MVGFLGKGLIGLAVCAGAVGVVWIRGFDLFYLFIIYGLSCIMYLIAGAGIEDKTHLRY